MVEPKPTTREAPEWNQYWNTHHSHVRPALDSPLRRSSLGGFPRDGIHVEQDRLTGWPWLKKGLSSTFLRKKCFGPVVRWMLDEALLTQRKGLARVSTLRLIVAAKKSL